MEIQLAYPKSILFFEINMAIRMPATAPKMLLQTSVAEGPLAWQKLWKTSTDKDKLPAKAEIHNHVSGLVGRIARARKLPTPSSWPLKPTKGCQDSGAGEEELCDHEWPGAQAQEAILCFFVQRRICDESGTLS